jgi:signal peptidase I
MDKLKKQFLSIRERFSDKRPLFERKIEIWKKREREAWYKQAKLLFEEALACEKEIVSVFDSSDWKYNKAFLKVKITAYEGLFKELMAVTRSSWLRLIESTVIVIAIVFLLRTFVFGIYHVPTSSAEPSLLVGDRVWGNRIIYLFQNPKPGDMVMFQDPEFSYDKSIFQRFWQKNIGIEIPFIGLKRGPRNKAKRIVAKPGDVIEGKIENGNPVIYKNGKLLNENYVNKYPLIALKKVTGFFDRDLIGPVKIPSFLKSQKKLVFYSYDPKKDFEEQPFYFIDYRDVLYDQKTGYMKIYKPQSPSKIDIFGPYIVAQNKYWVMGDNRKNSIDSREWGFVDKKDITGKASFIIWSLDSEETVWIFEFIKNPFRFFSLLRWDRFLKKVE